MLAAQNMMYKADGLAARLKVSDTHQQPSTLNPQTDLRFPHHSNRLFVTSLKMQLTCIEEPSPFSL